MMKTVNTKKNPGLAKLPTSVRNEMGYAKAGGKVKPKRRKRKPFEPYITMEAKGGGKVKGYKKGGSITYRMSGGQVVGHGYD